MADIYIDNVHKQLYVSDSSYQFEVGVGNTNHLTLGLSDFGELPGQSTWYIRSVRLYLMGYQKDDGAASDTQWRFQAGIVNRDISAADYPNLSDFQDVAGWPLNKVQKDGLVLNNEAQNWFAYQHTYSPRKNLTLNREQNFVADLKTRSGNPLTSTVGVYIHAERGD